MFTACLVDRLRFRRGLAAVLPLLLLSGCGDSPPAPSAAVTRPVQGPPTTATPVAASGDASPPVAAVPPRSDPQAAASDAQLEWERAALARNPALEVVAVDAASHRISVRDKASGALRTVGLDEVAAIPLPSAAPSGAPPPAAAKYAIERDPGGVTITGPGVEITSRAGSGVATTTTGGFAPAEGTQRLGEPMRCQGSRFLRLDNQHLAFAGDGIIIERGCELYLSNSRIEALGAALTADGAKVHLANSTLIGGTSSLKMQHGAEVYVGGSTLRGISRRFDTSELHDLGGNSWD